MATSSRGTALVPSFLAFAVVGLLEGHFGGLVISTSPRAMEKDLDEIAGGEAARALAAPVLLRRDAAKQTPLPVAAA